MHDPNAWSYLHSADNSIILNALFLAIYIVQSTNQLIDQSIDNYELES